MHQIKMVACLPLRKLFYTLTMLKTIMMLTQAAQSLVKHAVMAMR